MYSLTTRTVLGWDNTMDTARAWRACWCGKLTHLNGIALQRCTTRLGRFGGSTRLGVNFFFLFVSSSRYSDKSFTNQRKRESFFILCIVSRRRCRRKAGKKLFCLYRAEREKGKAERRAKVFHEKSNFHSLALFSASIYIILSIV